MISTRAISSAQVALTLLTGKFQQPENPSASAIRASTGADPASGARTAPGASDAIMTIGAKLQDFGPVPAQEREKLAAFGADTVSVRTATQLEGADFEATVRGWLDQTYANDAGYQEAARNGTLKIRRAVDVEGMNLRSYIYDMQSGGGHLGSMAGSTISTAWLTERRAEGGQFTYGTFEGQDYYATW